LMLSRFSNPVKSTTTYVIPSENSLTVWTRPTRKEMT
jgi:hypothetical protein